MKSFTAKLSRSGNAFLKKLPSSGKLPFFTLSFTLAALIITIIAVQQQQNLIQEAAKREPCENEDSIAITEGPEVTINISHSETPPSVINAENPPANRVPGQFIVKYKKNGNKKSIEDKVKKRKGKVKKRLERKQVDIIEVPTNEETAVATEIQSDPNIEYVQYDYYTYTQYIPASAQFVSQWNMHNTGQNGGTADADIDGPEAWDLTKGNKKITIAVLDSGIDVNHPDLKGKIIESVNFTDTRNTNDETGHGTHVAGIIAASGNNNKGVIGVCPECSLYNIKVAGEGGRGTVSSMIEGINWAIDKKVNIINISMAAGQNPAELVELEKAINEAVSKGILVVAAAGNCGGNGSQPLCQQKNKVAYPGGYEAVLSVGATDRNDKKYQLSSFGDGVDVAAPGVEILSTIPGGHYNTKSGTSMATPHVAGLAGLLMSTGMSTQEVMQTIMNTSDEIEGSGNYWAHGRISAAKALGVEEDDSADGNNTASGSATPKPKREKSPKPTKPCKPAKNKNDNNKNKPTEKPKQDKNNNKDNKNNQNNRNNNSGGNNSQNPACRLMPSLWFCNGGSNKNNDDCVRNPSQNNNNRNNNRGNNKNGQENSSNNPGNVNIGKIDNDGTSDTTLRINGQLVTQSDDEFQDGEDINSGGKVGGNNETNIRIDRSGQNQRDDQSGKDGNQRSNSGNNNNSDDCGGNNNKNNNNKNNNKNNNNNNKNNSNRVGDIICRLAPFLGRCKDDNKRKEEDRKKKEAEEKKKKQEEAKKKNNNKNVKGVSTFAPEQMKEIIDSCSGNPHPSECTPDIRALADIDGNGKVNAADYTYYLQQVR